MKKIWFSFILLLLILSLLKPLGVNYYNVATVMILLHSTYILITLMSIKGNKLKLIFSGGFIARLVLMFWDIYGRSIFILPNAGTDDDGFYKSAVAISENISLLETQIYGGIYAKINGLIFYYTGASRVLGNYINVVLGIMILLYLLKILIDLEMNFHIIIFVIFIGAFFPNSLLMSAMFRRENFITFFVIVSLYYFIKWYLSGSNLYIMLSIVTLGVGSMFHSGVIGLLAGYLFGFIFYRPKISKFSFSSRTIIYFSGICIFLAGAYALFGQLILFKFGSLENSEDLLNIANASRGGSSYLTNISIDTPREFILFTPIKTVYFLLSPMPWDWRTVFDVFTFMFDSTLYLTSIIYLVKNYKKLTSHKPLIICILISLLVASVIFGVGVGNAGTAMRHRQKLISFFLLLISLMINNRKKAVI